MISAYDAELSLALARQRAAELQAEAERYRLARTFRRCHEARAWWRRLGRLGRHGPGGWGAKPA